MDKSHDIEQVVLGCRQSLNWKSPIVQGEYANYQSVPICILHAVFSINTKYVAVKNVMNRYNDYLKTKGCTSQTVRQFIDMVKELGAERFATEVVKNKQRTSTRNGILKSQAALQFAEVLAQYQVDNVTDLPKILYSDPFCRQIHMIPGQLRSLDYFLMLGGRDDLIKADRMVTRFLSRCLSGRAIDPSDALYFLTEATAVLRTEYPCLTPRLLDNLIWEYESGTVGWD